MEPIFQTTEEYDAICSWCPLPPKMIGKKIFLTAFSPDYAEDFTRFVTDETTAVGLQAPMVRAYQIEEERERLRNILANETDGYGFFIWDKQDRKLIGSVSLFDIDPVHGTAEVGICIGERSYSNGGRGGEALQLVTKFGFWELRLENINLEVYEFNENAIRCYKRIGFKEYGRRHSSVFRHGRRWDAIYMEMLPEDVS